MGSLSKYLDEAHDPESALNDSDADGANSSEDRASTARGDDWALSREKFHNAEPDKAKADKAYDSYYRRRKSI